MYNVLFVCFSVSYRFRDIDTQW